MSSSKVPGVATSGGRCVGCGFRAPGANLPSGVVRLCASDDDCSPDDDCEGDRCALPADRQFCTHLTIPFMGVPAGTGFCARPTSCAAGAAGCVERRTQRGPDAPAGIVRTEFQASVFMLPCPRQRGSAAP